MIKGLPFHGQSGELGAKMGSSKIATNEEKML